MSSSTNTKTQRHAALVQKHEKGNTSTSPPPNVPAGGVWGRVNYHGDITNMMCCIFCLLTGIFSGCGTVAYLCHWDVQDAYKVNMLVYDHTGKEIGKASDVAFTPD